MKLTLHTPTGELMVNADQRGVHPQTLFLHGFAGDLQSWDPLWSVLPAGWAALRYDLRGYGATQGDCRSPYSHTDDLLALLDALALEQVDLVGVSMGAAVALHTALSHPHRVKRLVLISPSITAWDWSPEWRSLWQPIVNAARTGAMGRAKALWWQHPLFATTRAENGAAERLKHSLERYGGRQWLQDGERAELPDVDRLWQLRAETLLLSGECDMEEFRIMAGLIEGSSERVRREVIAGAGHMLHLERPEVCAEVITGFMSG